MLITDLTLPVYFMLGYRRQRCILESMILSLFLIREHQRQVASRALAEMLWHHAIVLNQG